MIGHLYYAIGLTILIVSVNFILNFFKLNKISTWSRKFVKVTGNTPSIQDYRSTEDYEVSKFLSIYNIIEPLWMVFGLMSASWYVFLFLIFLRYLMKIIKNKYIGLVFAIVKSLLILFLIINHFHLHIDLLEIIKSSF